MSKKLDTSIHQPHDKLFKLSLTRKASALDFLKHHAPAKLLQEVDIATLVLKPASFITKKYRKLESDVVYGVHTKHGEGYLYFLLEHQTEEDKEMPIRLLEYMAQLMRLHLKQQDKEKKEGKRLADSDGKLPEIYSLVLYAGKEPYEGPQRLDEAFARAGALERMGAHCFLVDLARIDNAELYRHGEVALAELVLKNGKDPCEFLREEGERLLTLINTSPDGEPVLRYMLAHEEHEGELLEELRKLTPGRQAYIMNVLQQREQQGMQKRELDIARKLRAEGADTRLIKRVTGIDAKDLDNKK